MVSAGGGTPTDRALVSYSPWEGESGGDPSITIVESTIYGAGIIAATGKLLRWVQVQITSPETTEINDGDELFLNVNLDDGLPGGIREWAQHLIWRSDFPSGNVLLAGAVSFPAVPVTVGDAYAFAMNFGGYRTAPGLITSLSGMLDGWTLTVDYTAVLL